MSRDEAVEDRLIGELEQAQARIRVLEEKLRTRRSGVATLRTGCGCSTMVVVEWPPPRVLVRAIRGPIGALDITQGPLLNVDSRIQRERRFVLMRYSAADFTCEYAEDVP